METSRDKIAAGMRVCLTKRAEELQRILDSGIEDVDSYYNACECYILLNSIHESKRTVNEASSREKVLNLVYDYEDKHYKYGN